MSIIENMDIRSKQIAIIASFAVIYAIMRIVPSFPVIGAPGASFSMADILVPIYAIIFGPYIAATTIFLGTFLGIVFGKPIIFLGWDFLPATMGALFIGMIIHGKKIVAIFLFVIGIVVFNLLPYTEMMIPINEQISLPYNWFHIIAALALLTPLTNMSMNWIEENSKKAIIGLFIISIIGTLFQHIIGGTVFVVTLGVYLQSINPDAFPGIWKTIFYVYPIERLAIAVISAIVATPILRSIKPIWSKSV
tara:strand:+ start:2071 stop:2820 length:750 start_codon:yes stop_codon:yes gene_type:complete